MGHPPNGTTIELHIVLKANRENALIDALHEVSHPRHPKYGAHLSREQVAELAAPHPDTLKLVFSWLEYNDVPTSSISMTHGGSWLIVAGVPVFKANKFLGASYEIYHHALANATILRTVGYSLPASLHTHVKIVAPTTAFTSTRHLHWQQTPLSHSGREAALENVTSGESSDVLSRDDDELYVTPSFLRWLYKMPLDNPTPTDRNKLGISGFANEFPSEQDLLRFMTRFRSDVDPQIASTRIVNVVPVNGGVGPGTMARKRGSADTQYSVALTFPTQIEYYTIGGARQMTNGAVTEGDHYLEWLRYMLGQWNIPLTISMPYSIRELDLPEEYAKTLCDWLRDLGARGVSILVASGDQGIGTKRPGHGLVQFSTGFPASCPYVTSVGGAMDFSPETGSKSSGGGFSAFFDRHNYQSVAINAYLQKLGPLYTGHYNARGRGVPDIAMQSMDYAVIFRTKIDRKSSTSFSTNTAAAIIALLNNYRVSNGKRPLGFLNYWLYEPGMIGDGLNDITTGDNPGFSDTAGFFAANGWDPVTGLGSLNYTLLQQRLMTTIQLS